MQIDTQIKYDFQDVLIKPKRSTLDSRQEVDLKRKYTFLNSKQEWYGTPIIAANMDVTGTIEMEKALFKFSACTALHKHYDIQVLKNLFENHKELIPYIFVTIGQNNNKSNGGITFLKLLQQFYGDNPINICMDVANGYAPQFAESISHIRNEFPKSIIMAGNVATPEMVQELLIAGADIIKIGTGPGSVCTTRIKTGVGYPQLSCIIECAEAAHGMGGHVCADGGCKIPADVCKAFGAGADFVMLGGMLAGTDQCEGEWVYEYQEHEDFQSILDTEPQSVLVRASGKKIGLKFYGMSSKDAMDKYSGGVADYRTSEGKCVTVDYKGPVEDIIKDILGGLRSACTYVGARKLKHFSKCCTFIRCLRTHNDVFGS